MLRQSNISEELSRAAYGFLESCVRHRDDMVIFEAARAIINVRKFFFLLLLLFYFTIIYFTT